MLFLPIDRKPDWRRPPLATVGLIVVNCLVFVLLQYRDDVSFERALDYYLDSPLEEIELPRYSEYLERTGRREDLAQLRAEREAAPKEYRDMVVLGTLLRDGRFQRALAAGEVIGPDAPRHAEWRKARQRFETLLNEDVTWRLGLHPYAPTAAGLFMHMFLHGSYGHLIGNMIFLFLFGFVVETVLGWRIYLPAYLLAGLASGLFWIALEPNTAVPGVGASGAISGAMGMYTVLFGLRRIRFLYSLLFYVGTVRAPAISILPLWIGHELYSHYFTPSHVNNLAHAGGLLSGAAIAGAVRWLGRRRIDQDYLEEEDRKAEYRETYGRAQQHLAAMELEPARRLFAALADRYPDDIDVQRQLFNIAKFQPASEDFHRHALHLLALPGNDVQTVTLLHETFRDYVARAKPKPRLGLELLLSLALRFAAHGHLADAERIVVQLVRQRRDFPRNAEGLSALVKGYKEKNAAKAAQYLALLERLYPQSMEAAHARRAARP